MVLEPLTTSHTSPVKIFLLSFLFPHAECLHTSNFLLAVYIFFYVLCFQLYLTSSIHAALWKAAQIKQWSPSVTWHLYNALAIMFSHLIFRMHTPATHPVCWHLKQLSIGGIIVIHCQEVIPQTELKHSDYLVILFEAEQTHLHPL